MKLKKYDNYLNEDRFEDEYFDEYGPIDDHSGTKETDEDMEHLLYLLRNYLKDSGIKSFHLENSGLTLKLEIVMNTKERLADVIKTFSILKKLSSEILVDYDAEFDIWETKTGEPLLTVDYYSMADYEDDQDGAPF